MNWPLGILDVSQSFLQSDLITPRQRSIILAPWFIPLPWQGQVNVSMDRKTVSAWGKLAIKPLYGTKCAPRPLVSKLTSVMVKRGRSACTLDHCLFTLEKSGSLVALAACRVNDILITARTFGFKEFAKTMEEFLHTHTGISYFPTSQPLVYLGLNLTLIDSRIRITQEEFADTRLIPILEQMRSGVINSVYRPRNNALWPIR